MEILENSVGLISIGDTYDMDIVYEVSSLLEDPNLKNIDCIVIDGSKWSKTNIIGGELFLLSDRLNKSLKHNLVFSGLNESTERFLGTLIQKLEMGDRILNFNNVSEAVVYLKSSENYR